MPGESDASVGAGSTDMGDVSHAVPSIHPWIAICDKGETTCHQHAFQVCAGGERGAAGMLAAAKAMALTAADVLMDAHAAGGAEAGVRGSKGAMSCANLVVGSPPPCPPVSSPPPNVARSSSPTRSASPRAMTSRPSPASPRRSARSTALTFGLDIRQPRFHVVVVGASGTGRTFCARSVAGRIAATRPTPDDLLLLPNPRRPSEPSVLTLPAGEGRPFVDAMEELHAKLVDGLRGLTDGERFKQARAKMRRRVATEESRLEEALKEQARAARPRAPAHRGGGADHRPRRGRRPARRGGARHRRRGHRGVRDQLARVQDEADGELRGVVHHLLAETVKSCFLPVRTRFEGRDAIVAFLGDVEAAVARELRRLVDEPRGDDESPTLSRGVVVPTLLTEHKPGSGAPVVELPYPTLTALFGRTHAPPDSDFPPEPGFAVAGALHEANGGFLILPAGALLKNESLYEQLKACLLAGKFIVPEHNPSYFRGTAEELLFPPIPLDLKVVLITSPQLYQELHEADPEFSQLFKVQARFEPTLPLEPRA